MTDPYLAFVGFYDVWSAAMQDDVEFYVRRALDADGPIVELAAGNGRVAIPTARAGARVIAVDVSQAMLDDGVRRAREAGVADRITFTHADMRDFVASPPVDLVTMPFRSFLHLVTTADQMITLANVHESLRPGGRFICNMFVPDPDFQAAQHGRRNLHGEYVDARGLRCEMWALPRYEATTQMIWLEIVVEAYRGDELVDTQRTELELRMVYRYEMEHLLERSGFEIEALYGGFDERPLTEECREMIWVARKP